MKITFKSCHLWEPRASCLYPPLVLRLLFLSTQTVPPLPLRSLYQILNKQQPTFSAEDTSFSLSLDFSTASDGEFGCFSDQNSSSKPRKRRSLLKELNLTKSDLTSGKRKLYQRIRRKKSATEKEVQIEEVERSLWCGQWSIHAGNFKFFECRGCQVIGSNYWE